MIYLTALDSEIDIVNGYGCGADDYITKPFSLMVLVSKVNALMRRMDHAAEEKSTISSGEIEVNYQEMKAYKNGAEVSLSRKELQLLVYLMENAGRIVSKEGILEHIWDVDGQFVDDNTVAVNISRLKNKLKTDEISNVRGFYHPLFRLHVHVCGVRKLCAAGTDACTYGRASRTGGGDYRSVGRFRGRCLLYKERGGRRILWNHYTGEQTRRRTSKRAPESDCI